MWGVRRGEILLVRKDVVVEGGGSCGSLPYVVHEGGPYDGWGQSSRAGLSSGADPSSLSAVAEIQWWHDFLSSDPKIPGRPYIWVVTQSGMMWIPLSHTPKGLPGLVRSCFHPLPQRLREQESALQVVPCGAANLVNEEWFVFPKVGIVVGEGSCWSCIRLLPPSSQI